MYMRIICALLLLLLGNATVSIAQQGPDAAQSAAVLEMTRAQRNQFLDAFNAASAKINALTEDIAKANARIKELEIKAEPTKPND